MQPVAADTGGSNEETAFVLEEIIVTATKRAESLQDVPLSITALTPGEMERQGIDEFEGFARQVPGLVLDQVGSNAMQFTIRGINTKLTTESFQQPVAVYLDELPMNPAVNPFVTPNIRMFDVERVEVLRGPQGTLFGSGALAGAVRIVTKKADPTGFDAAAAVDFGLTGSDSWRQRYNAMVNIPLVEDKLALRVVGYHRNEDGYIDNLGFNTENANYNKEWGGRASLRWLASDRFTATLMAMHQDSDSGDYSTFNPDLGKHKRSTHFPEGASAKMTFLNANLEYEFDFATLTSSTTYAKMDNVVRTDITTFVSDLFPWDWHDNSRIPFVSEELRLVSTTDSDLEWVLGAFFLDTDFPTGGETYTDPDYMASLNITSDNGNVVYDLDGRSRAQEKAIFGELSYHLTDKLTVTGGLRYASSDVSQLPSAGISYVGPLITAVLGGGNTHIEPIVTAESDVPIWDVTENVLTGKLSVTYQPTEDQTFYALASKGYRVAGGNDSVVSQPSVIDPNDIVAPEVVKSDNLWNYELGAKTQWMDNRLTVNVAAYYIPWSDIQIFGTRYSDARRFRTNAAKAVSKGIELEMKAHPTDALDLGLNVTLQKAEFTDVNAAETVLTGIVEGDKLPSPNLQLSGFAQYTWMLDSGAEAHVRVDAQHLGKSYSGFSFREGGGEIPNPLKGESDPYENVNVSAGWSNEKLSFTVYAENVFNNDDIITLYDNVAIADRRHSTLRPRTFGIRASWKY